MVRHENGFVKISIGDFHLPVAPLSVECGENHAISEEVHSFIHAQYEVGVPNGYCIDLALVQTKVGVFHLPWAQTQ